MTVHHFILMLLDTTIIQISLDFCYDRIRGTIPRGLDVTRIPISVARRAIDENSFLIVAFTRKGIP